MKCPYCTMINNKVIDSRLASEGTQVRRRRECLACGERFTTFESAELVMPRIIKSNGAREPFDEKKLSVGVLRSLEKRPVDSESVDAAMSRIQHRLRATGEREIPSRQLGEWVMHELKELDQVAFVRFASVYRSFEDVNEFREAIEKLEREPTAEDKKDQISLLPEE